MFFGLEILTMKIYHCYAYNYCCHGIFFHLWGILLACRILLTAFQFLLGTIVLSTGLYIVIHVGLPQ